MAKWLVAAAAAAILVLVVILWRGVRADSSAAKGPLVPTASKTTSATVSSPRPTIAAEELNEKAPVPPSTPVVKKRPEPSPEQVDTQIRGRFVYNRTVEELYAKAASCFDQRDGKHEKIVVRYDLRVADKTATISGASLVRSDVSDRALEDCVVDAIDGHTFAADDAPELEERGLKTPFSIQGLRKRAKRPATD